MQKLELKVFNHKIKLPNDLEIMDGEKVIVWIAESEDDFSEELKAWESLGFENLSETLPLPFNSSQKSELILMDRMITLKIHFYPFRRQKWVRQATQGGVSYKLTSPKVNDPDKAEF
ncbi:MAG TPA: hypothetical protein ENI73_08610 [Spirochaetes bacterium]|nr:hypothetical protein [Spirochaetota bacterium]